ncbi:hypothetical protein Ahy_B06g082323 isoform B [Arachis hypogaea]|uniref:Uncharacterized protein n=1 Tax=Arachis hypogaea TaxID=3818 RepID=A0A444YNB5_ARAHY|nr:hypothetical protein Ahy_B06g082323 isoform B [Arachis hypogaea]
MPSARSCNTSFHHDFLLLFWNRHATSHSSATNPFTGV